MDDFDHIDVHRQLKLIVLHDVNITTKELQKQLRERQVYLTHFTVGSMRRSFLHDLQVIHAAGLLTRPLPASPIRVRPKKIRPRRVYEEPRGWWGDD